MILGNKTKYLLKNLFRGILWLGIILFAFLVIKKNVDIETYNKYSAFLNNNFLVYTIYTLSELFFGIIPPEMFMIWALEYENLFLYILIILSLAIISYLSGIVGYFFGRYLHSTIMYRFIRRRFLRKYERRLNEYGLYLIIVAAVTPIPFSGICMLVGSVDYPFKKFLYYASFRFLRYLAYALIIWETVTLQ